MFVFQLCSTALVMDYEWFEPNTVWLVRPVWQEVCSDGPFKNYIFISIPKTEDCEKLEVEHMFNDGKADIDVCWNSRGDPCKVSCK